MQKQQFLFISMIIALPQILAITTTHHDKPENSQISEMATKMTKPSQGRTVERQKRLLPYINYYMNNQIPNAKANDVRISTERINPFLESNAIPGPFIPIPKHKATTIKIEYVANQPPIEKNPDFLQIYETLVKLKQAQRYMRPIFSPPQKYYQKVPITVYRPKYIARPPPAPEQMFTSYSPDGYQEQKPYNDAFNYQQVAELPKYEYKIEPSLEFGTKKVVPLEPLPQNYNEPSVYYQLTTLPPVTEQQHQQEHPQAINHKTNSNVLAKILKQLQNSNALPQTFTTDNIDNSLRTLVKILNTLRNQQDLKSRPIVVADEDEELNNGVNKPNSIPGTVTQVFPAPTVDGGTPGRPGIDYPALSSIPQTTFNCKTQRYKGFFADQHTNCQVWHYCDLNGGQASFLCPNGTIFSQVALTCDWWFNVKCSNTAQQYVLNERLYKYIIPLSPKFPEDYKGPLVDRYLALKFQEMEEKMKKQRKKSEKNEDEKNEEEEEKDDPDRLDELNKQNHREET